MKYLPLSNEPNVSRSRFSSASPSMQLDSRGYPHISWLEGKVGTNEINYAFWDGLKWSYLGTSTVYISEEDINPSPNSMVLDSQDKPMIAFSRKIGEGSRLSLATYDDGWQFTTLDVDYDVGWVGIVKRNPTLDSSSSSSGSYGGSEVFYAVVYDATDSEFNIYAISSSWTAIGNLSASTEFYSTVKISMCLDKIAIAFIEDSSSIEYNFFDVISQTWSFGSFATLTASESYGSITEMDMEGYYTEGSGLEWFCVGWLSNTDYISYISSAICYPSGVITPTDGSSYNIEVNASDVIVSSSDYLVNGYRKIGVTLETSSGIGYPRIVCLGVSSKMFTLLPALTWQEDLLDIEAVGNGNVFTYLDVNYSDDVKISFVADSGDIYYVEPSADDSFPVANPEIIVLNQNGYAYKVTSFSPASGEDILDLYNNYYGRILRDARIPLLISSNR